ncbi:thiopurine S-methyltransferase [Prosthecobacter fusiformis]|uniref:Thiopurine S-methyltransferase n=2 Tax=Prosthecobacter fusiformis TaxID=48464 RepID=A0A4V6Q598_9BACT|nr:methyltransferase [Prosthecobacter fusiformis]TDU66623.1 thiopurine S-methyltransferase [Prosthecobacter fusiformis]
MTDWESCYVEGNTPWDKGAPSPPLSAWVKKNHPQGRAVVPGSGIGHDVVMLVESGLDAVGVDLSPTAIQRARARHPAHADRFHEVDLFALPADWRGSFDHVFEHTCLCALPPSLRQAYAEAVHGLLKPSGVLVGIWFINPEMDPGESGPPFGISTAELDLLFPSSQWQVLEDFVPATAYDGREGRERLRVLRKIP